MQVEVWYNAQTGDVRLFMPGTDITVFLPGEWEQIGVINVIPVGPTLATMEISDDPTDTQGSDPED